MDTIRIIHNLPRSGGTIISKSVSAQKNISLLSEIHPFGIEIREKMGVNPDLGDPLYQFQNWYKFFDEEEIKLPIKTTSVKRWAEKLNEFADSSDVLKELEYGQSQTPNPIISLPTDFSFSQEQTANTLASARTIV